MLVNLVLWLACASAPEAPVCDRSDATEVSFALDQVPCVQLDMEPADFEAMSAQLRFEGEPEDQFAGVVDFVLASCTEPFPDPFTWFEADLAVDGLEATQVGVRKKGFVGSVLGGAETRPSLKVSLDEFVEDQVLADDTEQLTLNNNLTDLSRVRACTALSVFADAEYPAPRCNLASVTVNGEGLGVYAHVEPLKKRFLRRAFGDDTGSLYEATLADFTAPYLADGLGRWEAKTSDTETSAALLLTVSAALEAPDESLEESLDAVIDLDAFYTFWALETLVGHRDGYTANANNSYVYFDPDRGGRAVFVPWGTDDAMSEAALDFTRGEIARRISRHPTLYARYLDRLDTLLADTWDEEQLLDRVDGLAARARVSETLDADSESAIVALGDFIEGRRAQIEDFIAAGGVAGEAEATPCDDLGPVEDFAELGEVVGTFGHACAAAPSRPGWGWLGVAIALSTRRRRGSRPR